jgi:hypothetical protein
MEPAVAAPSPLTIASPFVRWHIAKFFRNAQLNRYRDMADIGSSSAANDL